MHLLDLYRRRAVPAAGLYVALTRRCPLTCDHCSTQSSLDSEEHSGDMFLRFIGTFTVDDHPDFVVLTGGEPLLRPALTEEIARLAHSVGAKVALCSGLFFAPKPKIPPAIDSALRALDHVVVSIDAFHEREVPRSSAFRVIEQLLRRKQQVSLQIVATDGRDPYLAEVISDVRRRFVDRVPLFVSRIEQVGRAQGHVQLRRKDAKPSPVTPSPCTIASWPVVSFDGTVVACCNGSVIDGPAPAHLRLGHAAVDGWPSVRTQAERRALLRAVRTYGPEYIASSYCEDAAPQRDYCTTCATLSTHDDLAERLEAVVGRPAHRMLETLVAASADGLRRHLIPEYAELINLGRDSGTESDT